MALPVIMDGSLMQYSHKAQLLQAADAAGERAARATEPGVRDTLLALMTLYRDMAKQIEQLEMLRRSLHQQY
jgi:hypothetical protein